MQEEAVQGMRGAMLRSSLSGIFGSKGRGRKVYQCIRRRSIRR